MKNFFNEHPAFILTLIFFIGSFYGIYYDYILYSKFGINILTVSRPEDFFFSWTRDVSAVFAVLFIVASPLTSLLSVIATKRLIISKRIANITCIVACLLGVSLFLMSKLLWGIKSYIYYIQRPTNVLIFGIYLILEFMLAGVAISTLIISIDRKTLDHPFFLRIYTVVMFPIILFGSYSDLNNFAESTYTKIREGTIRKVIVTIKSPQQTINNGNPLSLIGMTSYYHFFFDNINNKVISIPSDNIAILEQIDAIAIRSPESNLIKDMDTSKVLNKKN